MIHVLRVDDEVVAVLQCETSIDIELEYSRWVFTKIGKEPYYRGSVTDREKYNQFCTEKLIWLKAKRNLKVADFVVLHLEKLGCTTLDFLDTILEDTL